MVRNASNQRGKNSVTVALSTRSPWILVASKAVFLGNYLAVSTWILNGSSIECHEKKHQPFSLSGVRFGSLAIHLRENLLSAGRSKMSLPVPSLTSYNVQ